MSDKFAVGLVQMRCTTNKEENLTRAAEKIREAAGRGAQVICLHELFAGEYFCRTEDPELFNLAEAVPGPTTERLAAVAKEKKVALVVSVLSGGRRGFTTMLARCWMRMGRTWGNTGRCIFRMIRCITRNFILRREIWDF